MKILFFSPYFHPYLSGTTIVPHQLLTHLSKKNRITALTFAYKRGLKKDERLSKNLTVKRMPFLFRVSKGFISPQSLAYFWHQAKTHDVVFINLPNVEGLALSLMARLRGKPVISLLNCQVRLARGFINRAIETALRAAVFVQCILSARIISYPEHEKTIPDSRHFAHKITTVFPPIRKLVAQKSFLTMLHAKKKSRIWIGFVGRLAREKGIEYLIEAIRLLKTTSIELIFAGPGKSEVTGEADYFDHIQKLLKEKNIPHTFFGRLSDTELGAFYRAIDVLVLPSVNNTEVFGMVQVEAMLARTPVVASNLPGVCVPIQETGMGILAPAKSSQKLANAIEQILKHPTDYANEKLLKKAQKVFDIKLVYRFSSLLFSSQTP